MRFSIGETGNKSVKVRMCNWNRESGLGIKQAKKDMKFIDRMGIGNNKELGSEIRAHGGCLGSQRRRRTW